MNDSIPLSPDSIKYVRVQQISFPTIYIHVQTREYYVCTQCHRYSDSNNLHRTKMSAGRTVYGDKSPSLYEREKKLCYLSCVLS